MADLAKKLETANEDDKEKLNAKQAAAKKKIEWALKSEAANRIASLLTLARSDYRIAVSTDRFDNDPFAFNTRSGTIDLKTGILRPHDRADYITKLADVKFDPRATCPVWENFMTGVFPNDPQTIAWMQRFSGYCLTGDTSEHAVAIAWGVGGNGKSVFTETLLDSVGDYGHKANVEILLAGKNDRHTTERAALVGKRFVAAAEVGDGRRLNEPLVKECSGGDRITARFCFKDEFTFTVQFKLFLATNYKPEVKGQDEGIWRRLKLIPFTQRFWKPGESDGPPHLKADPDLRDKLKEEMPDILAWFVRGAVAWHRDGLDICKAVKEATAEYRAGENKVSEYIDERCVRDKAEEVGSSVLFKDYKTWSEERNERAMTQTKFGTGLNALGFEKRKTSGVMYIQGIRLQNR